MLESTVTSKGQTTVPAEVRDRIGAAAGTRLVWHVLPDGRVVVRAKNKSLMELAGALKAPNGKRVTIEQMNAWR